MTELPEAGERYLRRLAMRKRLSATERYLRQVADGLEAIGQAETDEILAELRSHITEATAEANGDEARALAGFGDPHQLAARILQERGLLAEEPGLRDAPVWMRVGAVVLDAARCVVILWLLLSGVFLVGVSGDPSRPMQAIGWTYLAAVVLATLWWWIHTRRRRGHVTAGMNVFGLRRTQIGDSTRLVRARDIPGTTRGRLEVVGSAAWALLLVLVVAVMGYGLVNSAWGSIAQDRQNAVDEAVADASAAEGMVSWVYDAVIHGQPTDMLPLAPAAAVAETALAERFANGAFDHYEIRNIRLPDFHTLPILVRNIPKYTVTAFVDVDEIASDGVSAAAYEYTVVYRITSFQSYGNTAASSGQWLIEDVARVQ